MENKVATITFHWATNYGAVLQSYALQQFLLKHLYKTEIINYVPEKRNFFYKLKKVMKGQLSLLVKEKKLKKFRKKHLLISKEVKNLEELSLYSEQYNTIICGSDQIWNPYFTLHGAEDGTSNLSYFLDFAQNKTKKIAYACSFGTETIPQEMELLIQPCLSSFYRLSVREQSGQSILNSLGLPSVLVLDPTMLLNKDDYLSLISKKKAKKDYAFVYILHDDKTSMVKICELIKTKSNLNIVKNFNNSDSIEKWLSDIYFSDIVFTNSFHGMVFSIIFHKTFFILPTKNQGMMDRIKTLLSKLHLEQLIIDSSNINVNDKIEINWANVDQILSQLKDDSISYLLNSLGNDVA